MALLEIDQIKKKYSVRKFGKSYDLMAVNGVSFSIEEGKCVGLVGESGCGKSTLGRLITGLEAPTEGQVRFNGQNIHQGKQKQLKFSEHIQLVFQDSFDAVNPRFTAKKIIEEPLKNFTNMNAKERNKKIDSLLAQVGIALSEKDKYALEFSGGQLQRVCIARALASNPELLVLDEPLSSLDVSVQAQILNLLGDIKEKLGLSYLLISHDLEAVYYLADAVVVMYGGQIMEKIDDIAYFNEMLHPYTRKLLSSTPAYKEKVNLEEAAETIWSDLGVQKKEYKGCPYFGRCPYSKVECEISRPIMKEIHTGHYVACHQTDAFVKGDL
jgi:oligopeptide/dipeptide ABC transporter ATP-binding protein